MSDANVFHNVPVLLQPGHGNLCWYLSYQMVVAYERGRARGGGLTDPSENPYTQAKYGRNEGVGNTGADERERVAGMLGFRWLAMSPSPEGMLDMLGYGPVIYHGAWGTGGHVVVIVGIGEGTLVWNCPNNGRQTSDAVQFLTVHPQQWAVRGLSLVP